MVSTDTPPEGIGALRERVQRHGYQIESIEKRLSDGADAFAKVRASIEDVRKEQQPKPTPPWKIASIAIAIATMVLAWVWQAAKYPDRSEFNQVNSKVQELKLDQVQIQSDINAIKASQTRVEKNIDKLVEYKRAP